MRRTAVLIEAARAKALRVRVIHHEIRCDVPGQVPTALVALLGVAEILCVEVERRGDASRGRGALLEASETPRDAARRGVVEAEMTRARRDRQHHGNQVDVDGGEERRLLGFTHGVLIEGGIFALYTGIHDGRPGRRAYVREAAAIARRARRPVRRTRRNGLVIPAGLIA